MESRGIPVEDGVGLDLAKALPGDENSVALLAVHHQVAHRSARQDEYARRQPLEGMGVMRDGRVSAFLPKLTLICALSGMLTVTVGSTSERLPPGGGTGRVITTGGKPGHSIAYRKPCPDCTSKARKRIALG